MGIFFTKNKENERNVNFMTGNKIGAIAEGIAINATLKNDCIFIVSRLNKNISVTLKYEKITDCQYISEKDIREKSKSVLGRAVVGSLFLGPVGAIVGGISGVGHKKITKNKNYIVINYESNNEIGVLFLEVVGASLKWDKFYDELREKAGIKKELSIEL